MRWPRAACNTSKCAAWTSIRSSRPAFRSKPSRFLDAYLLVCALDDSPLLPLDAYAEANGNFSRVTMEGRKPGLELTRDGGPLRCMDWADELIEQDRRGRAALDALRGGDEHTRAPSRFNARSSRMYR